jgi:hypothetical protein
MCASGVNLLSKMLKNDGPDEWFFATTASCQIRMLRLFETQQKIWASKLIETSWQGKLYQHFALRARR